MADHFAVPLRLQSERGTRCLPAGDRAPGDARPARGSVPGQRARQAPTGAAPGGAGTAPRDPASASHQPASRPFLEVLRAASASRQTEYFAASSRQWSSRRIDKEVFSARWASGTSPRGTSMPTANASSSRPRIRHAEPTASRSRLAIAGGGPDPIHRVGACRRPCCCVQPPDGSAVLRHDRPA